MDPTANNGVGYGFATTAGIPAPGGRILTFAQVLQEERMATEPLRIQRIQAEAQKRGISLSAAADYVGPGVIEVPKFETEILDMVRRRGVLGRRIKNVPATGQPSRYFEQRTIASGGFTDPRLIAQNPEAPQRSERSIVLKAISGQMNFGLFDVEVTRQQGMFSNLVAKDVEDMITGMLRTSDQALWSGTDTDLGNPTTNQYVGGLTQINRSFNCPSGTSCVDVIKSEVASIVSNRAFEAKPTAIYAHPQTIDVIEQEERLNHRQMSQVDVTARDNSVIAGLKVNAISTAAGLLPIFADWALPAPVDSVLEGAPKKDYSLVILSEDLVEYHYLTTPEPRVFVLGLLGNLATQYVAVMFGAPVFKGKADSATTPEATLTTYAHSRGIITR